MSQLNVHAVSSFIFVISPQVFGHQRSPSMEFKELTKKDAQVQLTHELQKLSVTCPQPLRETVQQDFDGFEKLFGRFINESGPSVEWDRIQRLPDSAVSYWVCIGGRL